LHRVLGWSHAIGGACCCWAVGAGGGGVGGSTPRRGEAAAGAGRRQQGAAGRGEAAAEAARGRAGGARGGAAAGVGQGRADEAHPRGAARNAQGYEANLGLASHPPPPTFLPLGNIPMVAPAAHLPPPCRSPGLAPPHQRQWVALRPFRIAITRRARARARAAAGEEALEAQARGGREAAEEAAGLARQREAALEDALRAEARETLRCVRPSVRTCHTMAMRWCCPSVSEGPRWLGWRRADGWTEVGWLTLTRAHARPLAARSLAAPPIPPSYRADRRGSRRRSASCACIVRIWLTRRGTPLPGVGAV
jgi:hypothetical protein